MMDGLERLSALKRLSEIDIEALTEFTCPICGKQAKISECSTFEQKDKTLRKDRKIVSGVLGKQYIQTTEVYSAYKVRRCKDCNKRFWRSRKIAALICLVIIPLIVAVCKQSIGVFFGSIVLGIIPFGIYNGLTWPKVDIHDAIKKNAIENNSLF